VSAGTAGPPDLRSSGERIEGLLASFAGGGLPAQERAEELVRLVAELYGAGLERVLEIVDDAGLLGDELLGQIADDELVGSLLLVHGLHPYELEDRIERALEKVRPYLGSHGGDVELLGVSEEGVVRLRLVGSCQSCPSSSVTLKLAVEGAIEAAAPEVTGIECEDAASTAASTTTSGLISVDSLRSRTRGADPQDSGGTVDAVGRAGTVGSVRTVDIAATGTPGWESVDADGLASGEVRSVVVAGIEIVLCRVGSTSYAFRDGCASCSASLAGASLQRAPGAPLGSAVLTCPGCRAHYEVHRAGASLDQPGVHLDPLPLLDHGGAIEVAVPGRVPA
jgi:Fe-S cluster biogenesis protein NfuA/nitrite reductase/ring-hydroxylating ferredoxin subunit